MIIIDAKPCMAETGMSTSFRWENIKYGAYLEDIGIEGFLILIWIFK